MHYLLAFLYYIQFVNVKMDFEKLRHLNFLFCIMYCVIHLIVYKYEGKKVSE